MFWSRVVSAIAVLAPVAPALADQSPQQIAPAELSGVLIAPTDWSAAGDPRLRRLAWRLTLRGVDSAVASDLARPSANAQERFGKGRRALARASEAMDAGKLPEASSAYDRALPILEANTTRNRELKVLVSAMVERGAAALQLGDSATAEAIFLRALALAPNHSPGGDRVSAEARELFRTVRDIVSQRPKGKLRVNPGQLTGANVRIDFGDPLPPPYEADVPAGTHYVSVAALERSTVITRITVRANDEITAFVRPPPQGNVGDRTRALAAFRPGEVSNRAELIEVAGTHFLMLAIVASDALSLELFDSNGHPIVGATAEVARDPTDAQLDRAIDQLLDAAATIEGSLKREVDDGPAWYATWWGAGLIGVVILGAAAGTVAFVVTPGETEYVFRPQR